MDTVKLEVRYESGNFYCETCGDCFWDRLRIIRDGETIFDIGGDDHLGGNPVTLRPPEELVVEALQALGYDVTYSLD